MRNIIWLLALFILLVFQAGVLLPLNIFPISLILVVVAIAAILSDFGQGLIITLMGGLMLDFVSGFPDGLVSISLVFAFLLMHLLLNEILSREPNGYILAASVAGSTILYFIGFLFASRLFGLVHLIHQPDTRYLLTVQLPLTLLWNSIFAYPILKYYELIQKLASRIKYRDESIKV